MPYYLTNYRIQFKCTPQGALGIHSTVNIDIADTESGETEEWGYVELKGAVDAFKIDVVNNDEDKYSPIKAKKATIQFNSTQNFDLNTFTGNDDRYLVRAWVQETSATLFKGFLVMDDMTEPYLPKPNVVTLVATDNIGLLKDVALTKPDGTNPRGMFTLIEYISWCLQKTGLQGDIYVCNNVKEEHAWDKIIYESQYLNSKTFEQEIGESEDCYTVLEKILGEHCFLTQIGGDWYIMRLDEYEWATQHFRLHRFDYEGTFIETLNNYNLDMVIGAGNDMKFSQEATEVGLLRPQKFVKETYNFEYPLEIVDNIDFERGTYIEDSEYTYEEDGETFTVRHYTVDDWTVYQGAFPYPITNKATGSMDAYIVKVTNEQGDEVERYLNTEPPNDSLYHFIQCNSVPMGKKDKVDFSVDFAYNENVAGSGTLGMVVYVWLEGEDGSYWQWGSNTLHENKWHVLSSNNLQYETGIRYGWDRANHDETEYQSITGTIGAMPVPGYLYIGFRAFPGGLFNTQTRYQNLQFTYKPFINGSYLKYKGQHHKVSQEAGLRSSREETVYISDSPRKLFKGALHYGVTLEVLGIEFTQYYLSTRFWNAGVPDLYDEPTDEALHPFGHIQAFEVWNQNNRVMRLFDATIQGLQLNSICPDVIHRFRFTDASIHNNNKFFVLLHYSMDFYTGEWTGTFAEVFDTAIGKEYESEKEFKYVSDRER
jgi:hypothetical protein